MVSARSDSPWSLATQVWCQRRSVASNRAAGPLVSPKITSCLMIDRHHQQRMTSTRITSIDTRWRLIGDIRARVMPKLKPWTSMVDRQWSSSTIPWTTLNWATRSWRRREHLKPQGSKFFKVWDFRAVQTTPSTSSVSPWEASTL